MDYWANNMNNDLLLPCPFCGHKANIFENEYGFFIHCLGCCISTTYQSTPEEAGKLWNTRTKPSECSMFLKLLAFVKMLSDEGEDYTYHAIITEATRLLKEIGEGDE